MWLVNPQSLGCHSCLVWDQRNFHRFVLICCGGSSEGLIVPTAVLFCGEMIGCITPVSNLLQQLDCTEVDDFLRFLTAVYYVVSGLLFAFRYQDTGSDT